MKILASSILNVFVAVAFALFLVGRGTQQQVNADEPLGACCATSASGGCADYLTLGECIANYPDLGDFESGVDCDSDVCGACCNPETDSCYSTTVNDCSDGNHFPGSECGTVCGGGGGKA